MGESKAKGDGTVTSLMHEWGATRSTQMRPHYFERSKEENIKIMERIRQMKRGIVSPESLGRQKEIRFFIEKLLEQEEIYWMQHGRSNWLLHGDRNTSYFHNVATTRKKRNFIRRLLDDTKVWKEATQLKDHVIDYFSGLFLSEDIWRVIHGFLTLSIVGL
jgi:hypothetical protein